MKTATLKKTLNKIQELALKSIQEITGKKTAAEALEELYILRKQNPALWTMDPEILLTSPRGDYYCAVSMMVDTYVQTQFNKTILLPRIANQESAE